MTFSAQRPELRVKAALIITLFLLAGCGSDLSDSYVPISEFHLQQDAVSDGDSLEIMGAPGDNAQELNDAYILYVARSKSSGKTVNILSTEYFQVTKASVHCRFVSADSPRTNASAPGNRFPEFRQVFLDRHWIKGEVRRFPAVKGILANMIATLPPGAGAKDIDIDSLTKSALKDYTSKQQ